MDCRTPQIVEDAMERHALWHLRGSVCASRLFRFYAGAADVGRGAAVGSARPAIRHTARVLTAFCFTYHGIYRRALNLSEESPVGAWE